MNECTFPRNGKLDIGVHCRAVVGAISTAGDATKAI